MDHCLAFVHAFNSKLCHDLVAPVGAIGHGLELLDETPGSSEVLDLLQQSGQALALKLSFYRLLFGQAGVPIGVETLQKTAEQFFSLHKLLLKWQQVENFERPYAGQLILNLIYWISAQAPRGGVVNINISFSSGMVFRFDIIAPLLTVNEDSMRALTGESSPHESIPQTVQGAFCFLLAQKLLGKLSIERSQASQMTVRFETLS